MEKSKIKIAFLSTFPPRECGLATFSKSFVDVFDDLYVKNQVKVVAVSDERGKYQYSPRVIFEIDQFDPKSYVEAAGYLNKSPIEVVSLQHEYGIFGGEDGKFILKFLENVNKPVVTSLHSVLPKYSEHRYKLTQKILDLSSSVVVMTKSAKKILSETFKINPDKIKIVKHGVPNVRFDEKSNAKELLWLKDKIVLSTFGLINRGKGIENVIKALLPIVKKFPQIIYLIIGVTHPNVIKIENESYRKSLVKSTLDYKLENHVKFINRYLEYGDLVDYLKATDIYMAPQKNFNQACSGTLSYAIGCGCTIISSPTYYAKEILASGRGIIIDPKPENIQTEVIKLLNSSSSLGKIGLNAYRYSRDMIWPSVGLGYLKVIESNLFRKTKKWQDRLPDFKEAPSLKHLKNLTDDFGIIQHADFDLPNKNFGYSLDDQARALIVCAQYLKYFKDDNASVKKLFRIYFNYLKKAIDKKGIIHNFINFRRKYSDDVGSPESMARSFWALSQLYARDKLSTLNKQELDKLLFSYREKLTVEKIRARAFALFGYAELKEKKEVAKLADEMVIQFKENSKKGGWEWFEDFFTWGNAILPYALLVAYRVTKNQEYLKIALQAINFLEKVYYDDGTPSPVGQNGWYFKGKKKALFDQQPIEAADMVMMYNELFHLLKDKKYREKAKEWMGWYFGNNIKQVSVYDNTTRGIYDGITKEGVNKNRGAEPIITYLMAYLSFCRQDKV